MTFTDRPGSRRAWLLLSLATVFLVWLFMLQTSYAIVSPQIQVTAHLSVGNISLAAAVYTSTFALVQVFSGALLDRFGSRPMIAIAIAAVTVGAFLYAATTNMATLILAQAILAVGSSFGFVGAGYVIASWFRAAQFGLLLAMVQAAGSVGSAVIQPILSWALEYMSWQQLLVVFGAIGVCITLAAAIAMRDPQWTMAARATAHRAPLVRGILRGLVECVRNPSVRYGAVVSACGLGAILAVGTLWGPRILTSRGFDGSTVAWLVGLTWLGNAIGAPVITAVSHRLGKRRPVIVCAVAGLIAMFAIVLYAPPGGPLGSVGAQAAALFVFGSCAGVNVLGYAIATDNISRALSGSANAVVNAFAFAVAALLQMAPSIWLPATPALADYRFALSLLTIILAIGWCLLATLRPTVDAVQVSSEAHVS